MSAPSWVRSVARTSIRPIQLRRLKFDVHVEEVFGGQAVEVR